MLYDQDKAAMGRLLGRGLVDAPGRDWANRLNRSAGLK
jgi:hypothetical protein